MNISSYTSLLASALSKQNFMREMSIVDSGSQKVQHFCEKQPDFQIANGFSYLGVLDGFELGGSPLSSAASKDRR